MNKTAVLNKKCHNSILQSSYYFISILEPGYSLKRGRILRQLHVPFLQLAKMDLKSKKITMAEFLLKTKQAFKNMNEAVKCMENFDLFIVSSGNWNVKQETTLRPEINGGVAN